MSASRCSALGSSCRSPSRNPCEARVCLDAIALHEQGHLHASQHQHETTNVQKLLLLMGSGGAAHRLQAAAIFHLRVRQQRLYECEREQAAAQLP